MLPVSVLLMAVEEGAKGLDAPRELRAELPFARHMAVAEGVSSLVVQRVPRDAQITALPMAVGVGVDRRVAAEPLGVGPVCV